MYRLIYLGFTAIFATNAVVAQDCDVRARTSGGWVCGLRLQTRRNSTQAREYASFLAVPYAKQPTGELRFKELQPLEPWEGYLNATAPGLVCPQTDVFYEKLMTPKGYSEECIHANIHVPLDALPNNQMRPVRHLKPPYVEADDVVYTVKNAKNTGLPILVFVHGGGFAFGSGDPDLHGPQHLVEKDVIVITFNYRLNIFGFLSLNTSEIPGNNGLRDIITLLRWVKDNAVNFGGNPDDVTLAGQSAGACAAHLLTVSPLATGLFHKVIIMSGTAIPVFYTTSPLYAKFIAQSFLQILGITSTDLAEVHRQLIKKPIEDLMRANQILIHMTGIADFYPVIESSFPGVKPVLPRDTETLLAAGEGNDIPILIGFTNKECESFKKRFEEIDIMNRIKNNSMLTVSPQVLFTMKPEEASERASRVANRYFRGQPSIEKFLKMCTEMYFQYPALKIAQYRSKTGGAPAYMYEFSYDSPNGPIRKALDLEFNGAGHVEDLTHVFHVNSVQVPENRIDDDITEIMSQYVVNFIKTGSPDTAWPEITNNAVHYKNIVSPTDQRDVEISAEQSPVINFFDSIMARS